MIGFSFDSMATYFGERNPITFGPAARGLFNPANLLFAAFRSGHGYGEGIAFKVTIIPRIGWQANVYFLLLLLRNRGVAVELRLCGQLNPLGGVGAAVDIVAGMIDEPGLLEFIERAGNGFVLFNDLFKVNGLIAELPEMMLRVMLIAVGEKVEEPHQPFFTGFLGVFGNGPEDLLGRIAFEIP
jgi:hypothetical protein